MSYVKLPRIRKMQFVNQGYHRCDGCGKRLVHHSGYGSDKDDARYYGINYRVCLDIGPCCEPKLLAAMRKLGFKFKMRRKEK